MKKFISALVVTLVFSLIWRISMNYFFDYTDRFLEGWFSCVVLLWIDGFKKSSNSDFD